MRKKEETSQELETKVQEPTLDQLKVVDYDLIMEIERHSVEIQRLSALRKQIQAKMQELTNNRA